VAATVAVSSTLLIRMILHDTGEVTVRDTSRHVMVARPRPSR
jgi:hypothetical protein